MSSILNEVTRGAIELNDYDAISATIGLSVILLLAFLLIAKEVMRARHAEEHVLGAVDVAIVPLLVAAGLVLGQRLLALIV